MWRSWGRWQLLVDGILPSTVAFGGSPETPGVGVIAATALLTVGTSAAIWNLSLTEPSGSVDVESHSLRQTRRTSRDFVRAAPSARPRSQAKPSEVGPAQARAANGSGRVRKAALSVNHDDVDYRSPSSSAATAAMNSCRA